MSDPSPPRLLPMLAGGIGVPADPSAHQMEHKFGRAGRGVIAVVSRDGVVLTNRRGGEITGTYPELAGLAEALAPHAAVLDDEVVTFNETGETSFQRLRREVRVIAIPTSPRAFGIATALR